MKNLKKFKELVEGEARLLKENATEKELSKLDSDYLDPSSRYGCIYGQMTGNCDSSRALTLMKKCCKAEVMKAENIGEINGKLNKNLYEDGDTVEKSMGIDYERHFWSPIEVYISPNYKIGMSSEKTRRGEKLIDFLKGKTDTFKA